jgi:hypothetical protein
MSPLVLKPQTKKVPASTQKVEFRETFPNALSGSAKSGRQGAAAGAGAPGIGAVRLETQLPRAVAEEAERKTRNREASHNDRRDGHPPTIVLNQCRGKR